MYFFSKAFFLFSTLFSDIQIQALELTTSAKQESLKTSFDEVLHHHDPEDSVKSDNGSDAAPNKSKFKFGIVELNFSTEGSHHNQDHFIHLNAFNVDVFSREFWLWFYTILIALNAFSIVASVFFCQLDYLCRSVSAMLAKILMAALIILLVQKGKLSIPGDFWANDTQEYIQKICYVIGGVGAVVGVFTGVALRKKTPESVV